MGLSLNFSAAGGLRVTGTARIAQLSPQDCDILERAVSSVRSPSCRKAQQQEESL
ncbi:hypothetical protein JCM2811A_02330 [Methylorubrum rhodinum]